MLRGRTGPWVLALALAIGLFTAAQAGAATYNVTTPVDPVAGVPPCTVTQCSLRAAVAAAMDNNVADQIVVPSGTYTLSAGVLTLNDDAAGVTITGAGARSTIITAKAASRVLDVVTPARVSITGVTISDGRVPVGQGGDGGNIIVSGAASLSLDHVRVTTGVASRGAGIAGLGAQSIQVTNSLFDHNLATALPGAADGGAIYIDGQTGGNTSLQVGDSTFASNEAALAGGAIAMRNNANALINLRGVTIASNSAGTSGGGVALITAVGAPLPQMTVAGSIVAANTANTAPSNCSGTPPVDGAGNVESGADCGLGAAGRQNTNPQLSADLVDAGGQTPVLALSPTSPAIDMTTCLSAADQRDVPRPQGPACDAGAFEYLPPAIVLPPQDPPPLILPPVRQLVPVARQHVIGVTASGKVLVRLPGTKRFVPLAQVRELPLGTVVNATAGRIHITSAADANGRTQTAVFYDGIFKIGETGPARRLVTVLALFGNEPVCPKPRKMKSKRSSAAAKKSKSRRLWGDGKGRFQTKGQYSSATVRGTKWLVQDSCKGTLTKVARGSVTVRDFVKRKDVIVKAGRRYLARPRR